MTATGPVRSINKVISVLEIAFRLGEKKRAQFFSDCQTNVMFEFERKKKGRNIRPFLQWALSTQPLGTGICSGLT